MVFGSFRNYLEASRSFGSSRNLVCPVPFSIFFRQIFHHLLSRRQDLRIVFAGGSLYFFDHIVFFFDMDDI